MYVCLCNGIRESDIIDAAHRTDGNAESVYRALGIEPSCGSCLDFADDLIADVRSGRTTAAMPACTDVYLAQS